MSDDTKYSFFNGESYRLDYPFAKHIVSESRPLPLLIGFGCHIEGTEKKYLYVVRFDYAELKAVFNKLSGAEELVNIEIEPQLPKSNTKVRLYNSKGSVELKKTKTD